MLGESCLSFSLDDLFIIEAKINKTSIGFLWGLDWSSGWNMKLEMYKFSCMLKIRFGNSWETREIVLLVFFFSYSDVWEHVILVSLVNHKSLSLSFTCIVSFRRGLPSHFSKFCLGLGECLYELRCGRQTSECCSVVPIRKSDTYLRILFAWLFKWYQILWFSPFCGVI